MPPSILRPWHKKGAMPNIGKENQKKFAKGKKLNLLYKIKLSTEEKNEHLCSDDSQKHRKRIYSGISN